MALNHSRWPIFCVGTFLLAGFVFCDVTQAQSKRLSFKSGSVSEFLRLESDGDRLEALQTAIVRYRNADHKHLSVDLIGAVHIGEADYYETLNALFDDYDVVLYELVAKPGTRIPTGAKHHTPTNPISFLQVSAQQVLGLESQLQLIDYSKKQLVHADLSPTALAEKMRERGDTPMSLAFDALSEMIRQSSLQGQQPTFDGELLDLGKMAEIIADPLKAKQFMAQQFATTDLSEMGLGAGLNQLIVKDRNAAAVDVLDRQIKQGKRKIAIFYGAAHMPDFEQRLLARGFAKQTQSWVTAWDLTASHAEPTDTPLSLLMQLMNQLDR